VRQTMRMRGRSGFSSCQKIRPSTPMAPMRVRPPRRQRSMTPHVALARSSEPCLG
jgi:hypothetical protein